MSVLAIIQQLASLGLAGFALVLLCIYDTRKHEHFSLLVPIAFALIAIAVKP